MDLGVRVGRLIEIGRADGAVADRGHHGVVVAHAAAGGNDDLGVAHELVDGLLHHAGLLRLERVGLHLVLYLVEGLQLCREVLLDLHDVVTAGGAHDVGDAGALEPEGGVRYGGGQRGLADGLRGRRALGRAQGAAAVGELLAVLLRQGGEVGAPDRLLLHVDGLLGIVEDDLARLDLLSGLIAAVVGVVPRLHLGVRGLDVLGELALPLLLPQRLPHVAAEGGVGEAGVADEVEVRLVVLATRHAASLAEVVDSLVDVATGNVDLGRRLREHCALHQVVHHQQLEVGADLARRYGVVEGVLPGASDRVLVDGLAVDLELYRSVAAAPAPAAQAPEGGREGDDHPEEQPDRDDPQDDRVGAPVELHCLDFLPEPLLAFLVDFARP